MAGADIVVVATGAANLASVLAGLRRASAAPRPTLDPDDVRRAAGVVLPGVGALGAAMGVLREHGLVEPLRARLAAGRPTLCVCLGLQLLGRASQESPDVEALGVFDGVARRFPADVRTPQFGWNHVTPDAGARLLAPGYAYFANSYRFETAPAAWAAAWAEHGGPFVAALERGDALACQFHPELSGGWGRALLARWVARVAARAEEAETWA